VYVTDVDGYSPAAGGNGVYGDDDYQAVYGSAQGDDLRLTVERRPLDAGTCASLPVAGAEPPDAPVRCRRDGDGWARVSGDRQEYAVARGDLLVRVSGVSAAAGAGTVRSAALAARPATSRELESLLPPMPEVVERGDLNGDGAPDNHVGAGG
jgi:hypothetical protein